MNPLYAKTGRPVITSNKEDGADVCYFEVIYGLCFDKRLLYN